MPIAFIGPRAEAEDGCGDAAAERMRNPLAGAHAYLFCYHVAQVISNPRPHLRYGGNLYVYVDGFPAGGTHFYIQDFQLVAGEFPL
jgi:hypothetical protein